MTRPRRDDTLDHRVLSLHTRVHVCVCTTVSRPDRGWFTENEQQKRSYAPGGKGFDIGHKLVYFLNTAVRLKFYRSIRLVLYGNYFVVIIRTRIFLGPFGFLNCERLFRSNVSTENLVDFFDLHSPF